MKVVFRHYSDCEPCEVIGDFDVGKIEQLVDSIKNHGYYSEACGEYFEQFDTQFFVNGFEIIGLGGEEND